MTENIEALVAIHGYSPEGMKGGKQPEMVWRDRLNKGLETIEKLERMNLETKVAISGAGNYNGKTEAEMIKEFAKKEFESFLDNYKVIMEDISTDTESNVVQLHKIAMDLDVDIAFVISSRDHVPRIARDWEEHLDLDEDLIVAAIGSDETYASSGKDPFILEAAMYEPFVDAFNNVWDVDPKNYEKAASEVKKILKKYQ